MSTLRKSAVLAWFFIGSPAMVQAAGFAVVEQNGSRLGNAYAGGAAESSDASVIFYNPAGMTHLTGRQMSVSGLVFLPKVEFHDAGSTSTGDHGGNAAATSLIPNLYYADKTEHGLQYGLAITAPAGVQIDYGPTWVGRYYSIKSALEVINIAPAIAARISPATSIGVALDLQYAHAELSKAIDFGSFFSAPQSADGMASVNGHDWAIGYHIGILHDIDVDTQLGLLYRSKVAHEIEASATFSNVPGIAGFPTTRAHAEITLPEVISFSGLHKLMPALTVMGDVTWTRWSRFKELRIRFDGPPAAADDVTLENWKNSWRYALGVNYQYASNWVVRAGIAHDQGPISEGRRTPAIPDGTRNSLAIGANYTLSKNHSIDFAYTHLFFPNGGISLNNPGQGTLSGSYTSHADIVSLQYNHAF